MIIDTLILGAYETNCYILRKNESSKDCVIIDTGLESHQLINFIKKNNLNPAAVILTHGHADHIGGLEKLRQSYPKIKTYIHKSDAEMLTNPNLNLSILTGGELSFDSADILVEELDIIEQADIKLKVLHTPGHSPGGISLYIEQENAVFTGDALFADSVGRTDFPNGSMEQLVNSIKEKLLTLPDKTIVYPGHGPSSTIAGEKKYNQYLQ